MIGPKGYPSMRDYMAARRQMSLNATLLVHASIQFASLNPNALLKHRLKEAGIEFTTKGKNLYIRPRDEALAVHYLSTPLNAQQEVTP